LSINSHILTQERSVSEQTGRDRKKNMCLTPEPTRCGDVGQHHDARQQHIAAPHRRRCFTEKIAIEQRIFMMLLEAQDTQVSVAHGSEPAPRK
jgi:hypothetical protein